MPAYQFVKHNQNSYDNQAYSGSVYMIDDDEKFKRPKTRYVVVAVVIIAAVALIVGLSVGLTRKSTKYSSSEQNSQEESEASHGKNSTFTPKAQTQSTKTQTVVSTTPEQLSTQIPVSTMHEQLSTVQNFTSLPIVDWLNAPCSNQSFLKQFPCSQKALLLVSLDGFRAEYLLRNLTPAIQKLRDCGVHTPYMRSVYPTLTFPNHYTIVTGLYPASHGIVGNSMYDPYINRSFSLSGKEKSDPKWWGGEPIWITAKKQGRRTASYFWVGSDVNISGVQPDIWKVYDGRSTFEERVDTVLKWLMLPEGERPDLITLYFDEPDHAGHGSGPASEEVNQSLRQVDSIILRLMNGLLRNQLENCVNLIVLADHGMADTSCQREVFLNKYFGRINETLLFSGTTGHINTHYQKHRNGIVYKNSQVLPTEEVVTNLMCKDSHLNIFSKETIPIRHHYSNNERIGNIVVDIEESWLFSAKKSTTCLKGNHGYDNIYSSMHALFLAHGPNFKQNTSVQPFENIELYNMMADLLNIKPAANNGTTGALRHLLQNISAPNEINYLTKLQTCLILTMLPQSGDCFCKNLTYQPLNRSGYNIYPFNVLMKEDTVASCILHGYDFSSVFSKTFKVPVLTSFTLNQTESFQQVSDDNCFIKDPRLNNEDDPSCSKYINKEKAIDIAKMFDGASDDQRKAMQLSSNKVPMFTGFRDGIWQYVWRILKEYYFLYNNVHVATGPLYDFDYDGRADHELNKNTVYVSNTSTVPLPTHFFVILMKCSNKKVNTTDCSPAELDVLSFILPHQNHTNNCLADKSFLKNNVARIRDIELMSGLIFFTKLELHDGAQLRTFLPLELWPSPLLTSWEELPCPIPNDTKCPEGPKPLLLISLDGFRADYLGRSLTPTIQRMSQCGVHTPFMRSVYPTVTFPNHYTIVTGLYPESHGIIGNSMYDSEIGKIFGLSATTARDPRWWKGEPIWITAKKHGLKTATYFWPGSDVNISGIYPDYWKLYDGAVGATQRIYDVLDWITMPSQTRPNFITLYFDEPDHAGHNSGPDSDEVNGQLETVDELINILMSNLYEKNLHNCINLIVVADHGMSPQSCERKVVLKDFYPNITRMMVFDQVFGLIYPQFNSDGSNQQHDFDKEEIANNLKCKHDAMKIFTKDTLPRRHHYTNSARIGEVLIDMKDEWIVKSNSSSWCTGGNHGWDNIYKNMHALFLAHGPAFKDNFTAEPFENIELYNLMTEILGITPAPNNGTQGSLQHFLRTNITQAFNSSKLNYSTCAYTPVDDATSLCGCPENWKFNLSDTYLDRNDNILVYGMPNLAVNDSVCVLHQKGYSLAYSQTFESPVWMITVASNQTWTSSNSYCIVNDTRIATSHFNVCSTSHGNLMLYPLLDLPSSTGGILSSLMVPMYDGFKTVIWQYLHELIFNYTSSFGDISITMGAIYDYNNDGLHEGLINNTKYLRNTPVPTHFYAILIKCKNMQDRHPCSGNIDILPFVLPNLQEIPNCVLPEVYLKDNIARIRDIEILTGIQLMTLTDVSSAARHRTFLPERLWGSEIVDSWHEEPCPHQDLCKSDYKPVLLISLDGFRADYLLRNFTPTISRLSQCGVHAPYMRAVYPTKTFPNHYTIVTGLYPESHGIIDNSMYDRTIANSNAFKIGTPAASDPKWWGGEPIWITANRQGLKTATYFWPGSDVKIQGIYPDMWQKYNATVSYMNRVQKTLAWLTLPASERPDFITLYFDEPDLSGHSGGPRNSEKIRAALEKVDSAIGMLLEGLFSQGLHHCVNLVIVADHGMDDNSCSNLVRLHDYVDIKYLDSHFYLWEGAFGRISNTYVYNNNTKAFVASTSPEPTEALLKNLTCASPHMNVFPKASLPVRHHYSNNERIDNTILDMDSGWLVTRHFINACKGGNHGYDNIFKSMEALILAYGPAFKWNVTVEPFENIELYNMLTEILNITAAPNNGTVGALNNLLKNPKPIVQKTKILLYNNATLQHPNAQTYVDFVHNHSCVKNCSGLSDQKLYDLFTFIQNTSHHDNLSIPVGPPNILDNKLNTWNVTLLYQPMYTIGYDIKRKVPMWMSQTINASFSKMPDFDGCFVPDPRLPLEAVNETCVMDKERVFSSLLFGTTNTSDSSYASWLSSSMIQMKRGFVENIWRSLKDLASKWVTRYKNLNIFAGPVYDNNHDSLPDTDIIASSSVVPSHFFLVITYCNDSTLPFDQCRIYRVMSFILPHTVNVTVCRDFQYYLFQNEARVRDVELITGMTLFTYLPFEDAIKLRTSLPERSSFTSS